MVKLSKIVLISSLLILVQQISYAKIGGFELIVNVPIGAGITLVNKNVSVAGNPKLGGNFQIGVEADIGYMFQIMDNMGVSLLGSIGYDFTGFNYSKNNNTENYKNTVHDIYIGFYPKFNISGFSIGINTGVKFDVSSKLHYETSSASEDINNKVKPRTYIRGTFDYSIFFKDNMAINVGLYIGYDWGFAWSDTYASADVVKNETFGNLDVGVQVGYRFGPKF
ncbi:hypothetical protein [uncultured Brachyspira sp.]|uniref:hypothetical protein n=1 Tax=uncultured Brachyspira sp. TaxID=221953 RepID=UPI00260DA2DC|nr:hypothetical protein [uncultured Brachyspira sp.]